MRRALDDRAVAVPLTFEARPTARRKFRVYAPGESVVRILHSKIVETSFGVEITVDDAAATGGFVACRDGLEEDVVRCGVHADCEVGVIRTTRTAVVRRKNETRSRVSSASRNDRPGDDAGFVRDHVSTITRVTRGLGLGASIESASIGVAHRCVGIGGAVVTVTRELTATCPDRKSRKNYGKCCNGELRRHLLYLP